MKTDSLPYLLRKALILIAVSFSWNAGLAAQEVPDSPRIRVESALVTVPVIVRDSEGRFMPGLTADSFRLSQDGSPVPISMFLTSEDPIKIALLLDTSVSAKSILKKIKQAAEGFLLQLRPKDLAMIVSFNSDVEVLCPLSSDHKELKEAIKSAKIGGSSTRMRDAVSETQNRFRSISGRKAIVLLTDGDDHGSRTSPAALYDAVAASSTLVYSVFYDVNPRELIKELYGLSSHIPKSALNQPTGPYAEWNKVQKEASQYLENISDLSAGRFYRSSVDELDKAFRQISDELRSQYLLGFYPENSKLDGAMHSLAVSVTPPEAVITSRRSYKAVR